MAEQSKEVARASEKSTLSPAEHRRRHIELHSALDELAADWVAQQPHGKLFSNSTIMELMAWSHQQTIEPTSR